jgi:DNA repair protein RecO (recombination protein O)
MLVRPFGETSQVVHLATPEHGMVAALAKGAFRPGPELQGGLTLGSVGEAWLLRRPRAEMELLRRYRVQEDLRGLRRDLARFYAASHVLALLRAWSRPMLPNAALFGAARTALRALARSPRATVGGWTTWFEARALAATGHRPLLEACAVCGAGLDGGARFSAPAGGLVHRRCAPPGPAHDLDAHAAGELRRLYTARLPELKRAPFDLQAVRAARGVHDVFLPYVLERRPPSLDRLPGRTVTQR